MKINIEDVLFWMDAIRNSSNRYRTLESFWKGQINSKIWLIDNLEKTQVKNWNKIIIYGGWNGVLATLIFNSNIKVNKITSVDIDPTCESIASTMNKKYEMQNKFNAVTANMCEYNEYSDVVINTSCEHITQDQYDIWLNNISNDSLIVLQSNNYFELDEHIRCSYTLEDFERSSNIDVIFRGELKTDKYTRFMLIGKKYV